MTDDLQPDERVSLRDELTDLREASDDDHFYGAWKSGGAVSGKTMAKAKARQRRQSKASTEALAYLQNFGREKPFSRRQKGEAILDFDKELDRATGASPGLDEAVERVENFDPWHAATWSPREGVEKNYVEGILKKEGRLWEAGTPNSIELITERLSPEDVQARRSMFMSRQSLAVYRGPTGEPVGYVNFIGKLDSPYAATSIKGVHVFESQQGKGFGKRMYDAIQDETPINLYEVIGVSNEFTEQGRAFAESWLNHRLEMERGRQAPGQQTMFFESAIGQMRPLEQVEWALKRLAVARISPDGMPSPEEN